MPSVLPVSSFKFKNCAQTLVTSGSELGQAIWRNADLRNRAQPPFSSERSQLSCPPPLILLLLPGDLTLPENEVIRLSMAGRDGWVVAYLQS